MARVLTDDEHRAYVANREMLHYQLCELQADLEDLSDEELLDCREPMLRRINMCMDLILETEEDNM